MRALQLALVLGCLGLTTATDAGLIPTKASQLVTVAAAGTCPIPGRPNAVSFAFRSGSDGVSSQFVIPPKQVFVLTDVTATANNQIPSDVFLVSLLVGNADHESFLNASFETAPASGAFTTRFTMPNGIAVKPGNAVCIELVDTQHPSAFVGVLALAHGFLAPDK
jgi:hypothetical protein